MEHFKRWAKNPEVRDWLLKDWISPEERERRMLEIFGLPLKPPDEAPTDGPESNPVNGQEPASIRPNQTESNQIKPMKTPAASQLERQLDRPG